jgi:hypothetical protein
VRVIYNDTWDSSLTIPAYGVWIGGPFLSSLPTAAALYIIAVYNGVVYIGCIYIVTVCTTAIPRAAWDVGMVFASRS